MPGSAFCVCVCAVAGLATLHGSKNLFTEYNQPVADVWVLLVVVVVVVAVVVIGGVFLVRHASVRIPITIARAAAGLSFFPLEGPEGRGSFLSWHLPTWYEVIAIVASPWRPLQCSPGRAGQVRSVCGEVKAVIGDCILFFC